MLIVLNNTTPDSVQGVSASFSSSSPHDGFQGYLGSACSNSSSCNLGGFGGQGQGISNYLMASGELIALWFMCPVATTWNTTLAISGSFASLAPASYIALPSGFQSGIIAACCLTFSLTILIHKRQHAPVNWIKRCFGKGKEEFPEEDQQQQDTEGAPSKAVTLGSHQKNNKFRVSPQISVVDPPATIE